MGIHQALIGGYALTTQWELIDSYKFSSTAGKTIDPSVTFSNAEVGDVLVVTTDALSSGAFGTAFAGVETNGTSLLFNQISNHDGPRHKPASGWAQIKTSLVSGQELVFDGNEGVLALFRPPLPGPAFLAKRQQFETTSNSTAPSHQNTSVSMKSSSLAVLVGFLAVDDNTPFSAPGSAVTVDSVYDESSAMLGYQKITSDGNYSWGQWGTNGTSTDDTASYAAEAFNTDWEIVSKVEQTSNNVSLTGLQENDLIVCIGAADSTTSSRSISNTSPSLGATTVVNSASNNIGVLIGTFLVPSSMSSFSFQYNGCDRNNTLVVRKQNATSGFTVTNRKESTGTASSFSVGSVSNLDKDSCVILCCFVDDDGSDTDKPFQGPLGASLISQSNSNTAGSNLISYDLTKETGTRNYGDFNGSGLSDDYRIIALEIENTATPSVPTWSIVDSDIKQAVGATFSVSNVQAGDFLYFTSTQDDSLNALPPTLSGWTVIDSDNDEDPSFKEQYRVATTNEGTVSVDSSGESESGALIVFRCSTGTTSLDTVSASVDGGSGSPQAPSANNGNSGTSAAYSLAVVSGYIDDDSISSVSAPSGLTLAGWASGSRSFLFFNFRSSLMIGYAVVPNAGTTAPPAASQTWTTGVSDEWHGTTFYIKPS